MDLSTRGYSMTKIDDSVIYNKIVSPVCDFCNHYKDYRKCEAFNEIPLEIWNGGNQHRDPYPNDNGIQFESIEGG